MVIRNSKDEVMASLSEKIPNPPSIVLLELLAARRAALFINEIGLDNSIPEGDSEVIINALNKGALFNTALGYLLKDTLSILLILI